LKLRQREIKIWCENKHIQQFSRLMVFKSISASGEVPAEEKGSTQTERELSNAVLVAIPFIHAVVHTLRRVQLNKLATKSAPCKLVRIAKEHIRAVLLLPLEH